ncbi:MAG: hypothetical protein ABSB42_23285 [Tepidisphaeraceae bacterium]|jgi:hypothetical protein
MFGEYIGQFLPLAGGTLSGPVIAPAFVPAGFSAARLVYVDGTNGSDATGNGTAATPYQTVTKAAAVATSSGQCIFLGPGVFNAAAQVILANGVSLIGCGVGITTIKNTGVTNSHVLVVCGSGSVVQNLTIDATNTGLQATPIGFLGVYGDPVSSGFTLLDADFIGAIDGLYCNVVSTQAAGSTAIYARNCRFSSMFDTSNFQANTAATYTFSVGFDQCTFNVTYGSQYGTPSTTMRCMAGSTSGAVLIKARGCIYNFVDTTNSSASGLTYFIDKTGHAEMENCTVNINAPLISQSFVRIGGLLNGDGNTINETLSTGLASRRMPTTPNALTVSSCAVTPALGGVDEVAVDAATLTTGAGAVAPDTLSINAVNFYSSGGFAPSDGQAKRIRIKNVNAGSTAMTLSFDPTYNIGAITIGTIAAGKRAYFDFTYDADNAKWDLIGYVNGL